MLVDELRSRGVKIPAPDAVVINDIIPERIQAGVIIYPGTVLQGLDTFIGKNTIIGPGGGSYIQNAQFGSNCVIMQGTYHDCTVLDGVTIRNGAEIREGCLLEEGVELGHTVGLKQSILFPDVVAGSLINFCDVIMTGGKNRRNHSEIGSCMALYNFTPNGDKFGSIFGDVAHGVFLNKNPIFIGGQTQIVSPVSVGFGSVIAAGSKLTHSIGENTIVSYPPYATEKPFNPAAIFRPDEKILVTVECINNLELLRIWYREVRIPLFANSSRAAIIKAAEMRIDSAILERRKRLQKFCSRLPQSLEYHREHANEKEIDAHLLALGIAEHIPNPLTVNFNFRTLVDEIVARVRLGNDYRTAIRSLPSSLIEEAEKAMVFAIRLSI